MRPHVCMVVMMYLRMVMVSTYVTAVQANGQTGSGRFLGHFVVMCRRVVDSALGVMVEGIEKGRGGDSGNFGGWGFARTRTHRTRTHRMGPHHGPGAEFFFCKKLWVTCNRVSELATAGGSLESGS